MIPKEIPSSIDHLCFNNNRSVSPYLPLLAFHTLHRAYSNRNKYSYFGGRRQRRIQSIESIFKQLKYSESDRIYLAYTYFDIKCPLSVASLVRHTGHIACRVKTPFFILCVKYLPRRRNLSKILRLVKDRP